MTLNINRDNFAKLAAYLENLVPPPGFSMFTFTTLTYYEDRIYRTTGDLPNKCGTVACAAGHGPAAGILDPHADGWCDYINRNFIPDFDEGPGEPYTWCFCDGWTKIDNTPTGAAARIRYMLEHGIPDNFTRPHIDFVEVYANA